MACLAEKLSTFQNRCSQPGLIRRLLQARFYLKMARILL